MKKFFLSLFVLLAVVIAVLLIVPPHHTEANANSRSNVTANEAKKAASQYFEAVQTGNVQGMMDYSHDIRYADQSQRKKDYKQLVEHDKVQEIKITQANTVSDSLVMLSMEWTENGKLQVMTLPVYKENGYWKVIVGVQRSV